MNLKQERTTRRAAQAMVPLSFLILIVLFLLQPVDAQQPNQPCDLCLPFMEPISLPNSDQPDSKNLPITIAIIPPGTILPVRLNSPLSSIKNTSGQVITGRVMQDVPLPNRSKIPEGSKVVRRYKDRQQVTDGPYAETKEQLMGVYVIDCASFDDALAATEQLRFETGSFEIRPLVLLDPGVVGGRMEGSAPGCRPEGLAPGTKR